MNEADLLTRPVATPVVEDFDDDLVHTVCDECDRALCDGGPCLGLFAGPVPVDEVLCVVCEELDAVANQIPCPYCGAAPNTS